MHGIKSIWYQVHGYILATSKLPFTIASWGCFGGREHRIITYRMRAPISRQSEKCLHKMADL